MSQNIHTAHFFIERMESKCRLSLGLETQRYVASLQDLLRVGLGIFDSDLFVMFGSHEAKAEYLRQQRSDHVETKMNRESPIAGVDPAVKQAEAAKRLKAAALRGSSVSEADRRYASVVRQRSKVDESTSRIPKVLIRRGR